MAREKPKMSRLTEALLETAQDMYECGVMDKAGLDKITMRHLGHTLETAEPIPGVEIRALREKANMSQAVFARCLNLTAGYVSQLERGAKQASGPALALLNVIRRKGIDAIL